MGGLVRILIALALAAAAGTGPRYPRRFATMCILEDDFTEKKKETIAKLCAALVCSLNLWTRPAAPPLVIASGLTPAQRASLVGAGAEVVESPGLPPVAAAGWVGRERVRRYSFHKLHVYDPAIANARTVAFLDLDALAVRNATRLLVDFEPPAALPIDASCGLWHGQATTFSLPSSGAVVERGDAYFNSGVLVLQPDAAVAADLWRLYASGAFAHVDAGVEFETGRPRPSARHLEDPTERSRGPAREGPQGNVRVLLFRLRSTPGPPSRSRTFCRPTTTPPTADVQTRCPTSSTTAATPARGRTRPLTSRASPLSIARRRAARSRPPAARRPPAERAPGGPRRCAPSPSPSPGARAAGPTTARGRRPPARGRRFSRTSGPAPGGGRGGGGPPPPRPGAPSARGRGSPGPRAAAGAARPGRR